MFEKIVESEKKLSEQLPVSRLKERPSKDLLNAASAWSQAVWEAGENLGAFPLTAEQISAASKLVQHPVFICGVHRSGTTLVRDLLDGHSALTVLPAEGSYLTSLRQRLIKFPPEEQGHFMATEWLRRLANPINQPPYWLLGQSSPDGSPYVQFVREFLAWWQIKSSWKSLGPLLTVILAYASVRNEISAKYWVDKTPTNERFLKRIWKEMPEARIIHVIRDPRDVFISRKFMVPWLDLRTFLHDIERSFKIASEWSERSESRYLLIKYEDLCTNPADTTRRIATFLDIEYTPDLLRPTVGGKPSAPNSSFEKAGVEGSILRPEKNKPDKLLSKHEYELLSAHVGRLAEKFGYPVQHLGLWKTVMLKLKYLFS